jgi:hypothetical protein
VQPFFLRLRNDKILREKGKNLKIGNSGSVVIAGEIRA